MTKRQEIKSLIVTLPVAKQKGQLLWQLGQIIRVFKWRDKGDD